MNGFSGGFHRYPDGSGRTSVAGDPVALRLAGVCEFEADIRRRLRVGPGEEAPELEAVLAAARDNGGSEGALEGALEVLHDTLQSIDLEGLDPYVGSGGPGDRSVHAAGVDRGAPNGAALLCPARKCLRFGWPNRSETPWCAVKGSALLSRGT